LDYMRNMITNYNKSINFSVFNEHTIPLDPAMYKPPYNSIRRAKIMVFAISLQKYDQFIKMGLNDKTSIITSIERSCFNHSIDVAYMENILPSWDVELFSMIYNNICYRVCVNISPNEILNNDELGLKILNKEISIEQLPKLTSIEMFPKNHKDILDRMEQSKNAKTSIKTTNMYKCGKCYSTKCTMEQLYNRSLDEGVNLKLTCVKCSHSFSA